MDWGIKEANMNYLHTTESVLEPYTSVIFHVNTFEVAQTKKNQSSIAKNINLMQLRYNSFFLYLSAPFVWIQVHVYTN